MLPLRTVGVLRELATNLGNVGLMDLVFGLAEGLPSGMYSSRGHREVPARGARATPTGPTTSASSSNELYLTATDLDTCERIVMGAGDWDDVPISAAASASTSLPMIYKPVELKGRQLIDGGIRSTTNVDIAVEAGATFVVVVNPLVPYVNDFQKVIPTMTGSRVRRVADMGFPQIGYQAFKLLAHQRLHEAVTHWQERYPGVDIILIEPDPNDELMFDTNIMNFTKRVDIARHGFESVTLQLAKDYDRLRAVCAKHGIEISATRVRKVIRHFSRERSARARGGGSSSRRPARCCASPPPKTASPSRSAPRARPAAARRPRRRGSPRARGRRRPARRRGRRSRRRAPAGRRARAPVRPGRPQPDEVRLRVGRVDRHVVQRVAGPARAARSRGRAGAGSRGRRSSAPARGPPASGR